LVSVLDEDDDQDIWLHRNPKPMPNVNEHPELEPMFNAYSELRIEHQLKYAHDKLRFDGTVFSSTARRQLQVIEWMAVIDCRTPFNPCGDRLWHRYSFNRHVNWFVIPDLIPDRFPNGWDERRNFLGYGDHMDCGSSACRTHIPAGPTTWSGD
jgi:hypothetical protein